MAETETKVAKAEKPAKAQAAPKPERAAAPKEAKAPVRPVKRAAAAKAEKPEEPTKAAKPAPRVAKAVPSKPLDPNLIIIDASATVLGRAATHIAKLLLTKLEAQVVVVNAEKAIVTGPPVWLRERYRHRRDVGAERFGPWYPRRADRIFKRAVRGMLPYQRLKGRQAIRRLRCYYGVPSAYVGAQAMQLESAKQLRTAKFLTLEQISSSIGFNASG